MKVITASLLLLVLTGCASYKVIVYGPTGKQYTAPDLCGAIVQCQQANELSCKYNSTVVVTPDGKATETSTCKAAQ
jgi:hypothetical protein